MNDVLQFKVIENEEDKVEETLSHISIKIEDDGSYLIREERGLSEIELRMHSYSDLTVYLEGALDE